MKILGPHVHTVGGVQNAPLNANAIGATAFGLFTKNQRRWESKPLDKIAIDSFHKNMELYNFKPYQVLAHDGYLINIGHPDRASREKSYVAFVDEIKRCMQLGLSSLNIHPGSHLNLCSEEQCLSQIAESINFALQETSKVTVVLENTAGQGSNVGYKFEHIATIIDKIEDKSRIGFCIDTCHTFAAGYDIRTVDTYLATMNTIEKTIGFKYLKGVHLNDAKISLGSNVDRHESIGKGQLGIEPFKLLMNDIRFENVPMILETIDEALWPLEIKVLYGLINAKE